MSTDIVRDYFIDHQTWIFALLVLVVCLAYYRDPKKYRATTTCWKYISGFLIYSSFGILTYLIFAAFPDLVAETLRQTARGRNSDELDLLSKLYVTWANYLPALTSFLLVWLSIRYVRPLREQHAKLLDAIRGLVNIPVEQKLLALQLSDGKYDLLDLNKNDRARSTAAAGSSEGDEKTLGDQVEDVLRDNFIDERDWIFEPENNLRYQWAKAVSLFLRFEREFSNPQLRAYSRLFPGQLKESRNKFEALREEVPPLIRKIRGFLDSDANPTVEPRTQQEQILIREEFDEELDYVKKERLAAFLKQLHVQFAGMIHCCAATTTRRRQLMYQFGFESKPGIRDIASPLMLAFFGMMVVAFGIFPQVAPESLYRVESVFRIFSTMFGAIFVALMVIKSTQFEPRQLNPGDPEWSLMLWPVVKAFCFGALIGLGVDWVIVNWMPPQMRTDLGVCYKQPLAFVPAVTAAVVTFLVLQQALPRNRWLDGAILAGALVIALLTVMYNLAPLVNQPPLCNTWNPANLPPIHTVVTVSASIGIVIGCTIPHWMREKEQDLKPVQIEPMTTASDSDTVALSVDNLSGEGTPV